MHVSSLRDFGHWLTPHALIAVIDVSSLRDYVGFAFSNISWPEGESSAGRRDFFSASGYFSSGAMIFSSLPRRLKPPVYVPDKSGR